MRADELWIPDQLFVSKHEPYNVYRGVALATDVLLERLNDGLRIMYSVESLVRNFDRLVAEDIVLEGSGGTR